MEEQKYPALSLKQAYVFIPNTKDRNWGKWKLFELKAVANNTDMRTHKIWVFQYFILGAQTFLSPRSE